MRTFTATHGQDTKADLDLLRTIYDIDLAYRRDIFMAGLVLVLSAADIEVPCCAEMGLWLVVA